MKAAVFYATREGQAERVAEHIACDLRARHIETDVVNVKHVHDTFGWHEYDAAFVVASVHAGHHEKEMIQFVKHSTPELERLHAPFFSLTLSQAGAEVPNNTPAQRETAHADALRMVEDFTKESGWRPEHALTVAGALAYSKYNFVVKWMMKRIARKAGFDGPPTRDYEFTNWTEVDRFVEASWPDTTSVRAVHAPVRGAGTQ
jgi:menaquinone-dependent protoporphyrinogen oxidase